MMKFLPLLPVFLLCFAGGMKLRTAPVGHSASLRATCVLAEPPDATASFEKWVKAQKQVAVELKAVAKTSEAYNKIAEENKRAHELISIIGVSADTLAANKKQIEWCNNATAQTQPSFTELKTVVTNLGTVIESITKGNSEDFQKRLELYGKYKLGHKEYLEKSEEMQRNVTAWYKANPAPAP